MACAIFLSLPPRFHQLRLQGRYLPIFGAAVYDQNPTLVAKGLTPVNLKSVLIGQFLMFSPPLLITY